MPDNTLLPVDADTIRHTYNSVLRDLSLPTTGELATLDKMLQGHVQLLALEVQEQVPRMQGETRRLAVHVLARTAQLLEDVECARTSPVAQGGTAYDLAIMARALLSLYRRPGQLGEWNESGVVLPRCGTLFAAVAVSTAVVHAVADTGEPEKVDSFLVVALHGGLAFVDRQTQQYYFLVEASVQGRQEWSPTRLRYDANLLGRESYLGVPSVGATDPARTRRYWSVPMVTPAGLGSVEAVSQPLAVGQLKGAASGEGMDW